MKTRSVGIVLSYVNTFLNMVCGLFLSAYLVRMLGDTDYGVYKTVSSFVNYLVLLEFGTGAVMTRNLSSCRAKNDSRETIQKNVSTIWSITNVLSIVIALVSIIFYLSFSGIYANSLTAQQIVEGKQIFIFVTLYLLVSFFSSTLNGVAMGFEEYTLNAKVSLIRILSRTALLVALIACFKKAIIIAMVDAGLGLLISVFLFAYCRKKYSVKFPFFKLDKTVFKTALPLCVAIFLQAIVNQANSTVATFITGIKLSPEMVTLYSIGLYIYSLFSSLTTLPISMYAPQIVKDVTNGVEGRDLLNKMIQPSRFIVLLGGVILFGFVAVGRQFISIVYGEKYWLAWVIAIIIMAPMFFNMTTGLLVNVLDATNKRMARSLILTITTVINILLTIFLIDVWGVIGAALSTGICTLAGQVILMNVYYVKALKIDVFYLYYRSFKGILLYQMLASAVAFCVAYFIPNVYLAFVVGGITFVALLGIGYLCFGANQEEKQFIDKLLARLKLKRR